MCVCAQVSVAQAQNAAPVAPLQNVVLAAQVKTLAIDELSAYWVDTTGNTTIEQLHARTDSETLFTRRQYAQNHAIHGKALWIKFDAHITDSRARWFLEIPMATLDDATLYWRNGAGAWAQLRAGDLVPRAQWPQPDRFAVFR